MCYIVNEIKNERYTMNNPQLPNMTTDEAITINHRLAASIGVATTFHLLDYTFRPVLCHLTTARRLHVGMHTHRYCELTFVTGAPMHYCTPDEKIQVEDGQIFIMPPGVIHDWKHSGKSSELWGFMLEVGHKKGTDGRLLEQAAAAANYHLTPLEETTALFKLFIQDAARKKNFIPTVSASLAQAFLASVLREVFSQLPENKPVPQKIPVARGLLVERAMHYMRVNLSHSPRAEELAHQLGISVRQLHRIFLTEQGIPLGEWFSNERMARAQALVANEYDLPIKNIAAECGFSTASNFCLRFKERFLHTPSQYRDHCIRKTVGTEKSEPKNNPIKGR
jgi:AraC-like DNA-binding protein/mannose-6-phosphate isomerase-like protein (cupin superfamily)